MSRYIHIDEDSGKAFKTKPIQQKDFNRVAIVACEIIDKYLSVYEDPAYFEPPFDPDDFLKEGGWNCKVNKGSITLHSGYAFCLLITVFIDYQNQLANKCGLQIHSDPLVVGVTLTEQHAYIKDVIRNDLGKKFKYYLDPRNSKNSKWSIQPNQLNKYDILFLEQGSCPREGEDKIYNQILKQLNEKIYPKESDEESNSEEK